MHALQCILFNCGSSNEGRELMVCIHTFYTFMLDIFYLRYISKCHWLLFVNKMFLTLNYLIYLFSHLFIVCTRFGMSIQYLYKHFINIAIFFLLNNLYIFTGFMYIYQKIRLMTNNSKLNLNLLCIRCMFSLKDKIKNIIFISLN